MTGCEADRTTAGERHARAQKKPVISDGLMVVKAGLEPARRLKHKILNTVLDVDSQRLAGLFFRFCLVRAKFMKKSSNCISADNSKNRSL